MAWINRLVLGDFRSYLQLDLELPSRSVYLFGSNGSGKTNLLEALSLLSPGRGLRGASLSDLAWRARRNGPEEAGEDPPRPWSVFASLSFTNAAGDPDEVGLGTGSEGVLAGRRSVRIDAQPVPPSRLSEYLRLVWLTPAQDRLFIEGASERRRFLDRLVFAHEPDHARAASSYEKALRDRTRLLCGDQPSDPAWLTALEGSAAEAGARLSINRARTLDALAQEIADRGDRAFPQAGLALSGDWEQLALSGVSEEDIVGRLAEALARSRDRDRSAGRALTGPHRTDLVVTHMAKGRQAAECSTGEQKALILNLVLAQASRLARVHGAPNPIVLLDEVAAHLDPERRAALAAEIRALGLQAFLTGTDQSLFEDFKDWACGFSVREGVLKPVEWV